MRVLVVFLLVCLGGALRAEDFIQITRSGGMMPLSEEWKITADGQVSYFYDQIQNDEDDRRYEGMDPGAFQEATKVLRRHGFSSLHRFCRRKSAGFEPPFAYDKATYEIIWSRNGEELMVSDSLCPEGYDITDWYVQTVDGLAWDISHIVDEAVPH